MTNFSEGQANRYRHIASDKPGIPCGSERVPYSSFGYQTEIIHPFGWT
jgi:hypothetical protein